MEIVFEAGKILKNVAVYWYDDRGGVQLPEKWWLEGMVAGGDWKRIEIYNTDSFSLLPDQFNLVNLAKPAEYRKMRIYVKGKKESAVGILEAQLGF